MAITVETMTQIGQALWRFYAESDSVAQPTFYLWADGMIAARVLGIEKTGGGWYFQRDIAAPADGIVCCEIFDSSAGTPSTCYPGRQFLQWEREENAQEYWVEEYVDAAWVIRQVIRETGAWLYSHTTRYLEDCTTHIYRIRIMATNQQMSVARTFSFRMVRRPDKPTTTYTYEAEKLSATGWTSTGWTGSYAAGWKHTVGNTTALLNSYAAVAAVLYLITFTVTGRTAGDFTITFGGETSAAKTATGTYAPTASTTGGLIITPSSTFDGTIVLSIKKTRTLSVSTA